MKKTLILLLVLILGSVVAWQLLSRTSPNQFAIARAGYEFQFPRDHASHPDFQTEWWYYTGHLKTDDDRRFGFQITFFRHGVTAEEQERNSQWSTQQLYFAHFAVTDEKNNIFRYHERLSRGSSMDNAGAETAFYRTWIEDWVAEGLGRFHRIEARTDSLSLNLILLPKKTPVINGENGISKKADGAGNASHYYSITRSDVEGVLVVDGTPMTVTGAAWLDREFGTSQLGPQQVGWDWFSIQLNNNEEIMIYLLRNADGTIDHNSSGTYVFSDGSSDHLRNTDIQVRVVSTWKSRKTGATYPASWRIEIPQKGVTLNIEPTVSDQELLTQESTRIAYWEGSVNVEGTAQGKPVRGVGYTELTGYAKPLNISQ
jgi:predicted secreted hydrolase